MSLTGSGIGVFAPTVYKSPTDYIKNNQIISSLKTVDDIPDELIGTNYYQVFPLSGEFGLDMSGAQNAAMNMGETEFKPQNAVNFNTNTGLGIPTKNLGVGTFQSENTAQMAERGANQLGINTGNLSTGKGKGTTLPVPQTNTQGAPALSEGMKAGIGVASNALTGITSALANTSQNQYQNELAEWKSQGKWWFDKNESCFPTFEDYLGDMPSATDSVSEGTLSGGHLSESSGGRAGLAIATGGLSGLMKNKKQAEYIWNKGGEGAAQGASAGGWVGAIVGGAVGIIQGVFGWGSAEEKDRKEKEKAYKEWKRRLKEWTYQKNKEATATQAIATEANLKDIQNTTEIGYQRKQEQKQIKSSDAQKRYSTIMSILQSTGAFKSAKQNQRMSRWS